MNKRSANDGCLNSLDLIHQNKLFQNHLIYFTCFLFVSVLVQFLKLALVWSAMIKKNHLIFSNKNKFSLMLYKY